MKIDKEILKKIDSRYESKNLSFCRTEEQKNLISMNNQDYDKYMCNLFPKMFKDRNAPMTETCMCWGFEIGKGWYPLLHELCVKLELICKPYNVSVVFDQIKEKFSSARFYYHFEELDKNIEVSQNDFKIIYDIVDELISKYESKAYNICSQTGLWYDYKISDGWIHDLSLTGFKILYKDSPERIKYAENCVLRQIKTKNLSEKIKMISCLKCIEKINNIVTGIEKEKANCLNKNNNDS